MSRTEPVHIAFIDGTEIRRIENNVGLPPKHLTQVDGHTVYHIPYQISNLHAFIEGNYFDPRHNDLLTRAPKPNHVATWDATASKWVWDHSRLLDSVRTARDIKLTACDWTQVPDNQLTEVQRNDWRNYRQALRDITLMCDGITNVDDVVWPTQP